jgi:hypoxanthine phosphoribosyltransferase
MKRSPEPNQTLQVLHNGKLFETAQLFSAEQISVRIAELSREIMAHYEPNETISVLVVLHGAFLFAADLVRQISHATEIVSVRLKSYEGTESTGVVRCEGNFPNLVGKSVLVVEDIVDTGRSMAYLLETISAQGPRSIRVASFLDKPGQYPLHLKPQHVGFSIGKNFVIGYGLDLDGKYRNLPYVAELKV